MLGRRVIVPLACLCCGCATKALVRPDDSTFRAAEQHLRESAERLVAPASLSADETLFLQAESFYHYRFELRRARSAGSYLAQAAAAFSDFAPLTVLAASQGMFDLRLRAYDGSAQLYQSLVTRYPESRLRPLALYRLGWACRSTSDEGFSCSPEEAVAALEREYPGTGLAALARDALVEAPGRSLDRATVWSILPGAGQIYVGEVLNGTVRLSIATGFGALALVPILVMVHERRFGWFPTALSLAGLVGLQVTYTASYQDAQRAVLDFNERQEAAFRMAHPLAP